MDPAPGFEKRAVLPPAAETNGYTRRVELRPSSTPNTAATRVDGTYNSAEARWHLVSGDGVLFCLPDDLVGESTHWRALSPRELHTPEPADALRLVLRLRTGYRLDVLPTPGWPLADTLLAAALFAAKHGLPVSPLCGAYVQLLAWRTGVWAHVFRYGVAVGERGILGVAAVKIVEVRKGGGTSQPSQGKGGRGGEKEDHGKGENVDGEDGMDGKAGKEEGERGQGQQRAPESPGARLEWALDKLAGWWDPLTGWRGTSEMSPEDRYWRYVTTGGEGG